MCGYNFFSLVAAVWQWWARELERGTVLCRATCLHRAFTTHRDDPTFQVPTCLLARVAGGRAVPSVEVVSPQSQGQQEAEVGQAGARGKRKAADEKDTEPGAEEEVDAVLKHVVTGLNEALVTELLEGFHSEK